MQFRGENWFEWPGNQQTGIVEIRRGGANQGGLTSSRGLGLRVPEWAPQKGTKGGDKTSAGVFSGPFHPTRTDGKGDN